MPLLSRTKFPSKNYEINDMLEVFGFIMLILAIGMVTKALIDLGYQYNPTLIIKKNHKLITTGIYSTIRHPMYSSLIPATIAVALLVKNKIAVISFIIASSVLIFGRVPSEEEMMIKEFGDGYRSYMKKTYW